MADVNSNLLNGRSAIYQSIATMARLRNSSPILKFGRMYMRRTSEDGLSFHLPVCAKCILAFSRILFNEEVLVVYNSSISDAKVEYVEIDYRINKKSSSMKNLFGYDSCVEVLQQEKDGSKLRYVRLYLNPMQFVILKNV